jgi:hypothetical protein
MSATRVGARTHICILDVQCVLKRTFDLYAPRCTTHLAENRNSDLGFEVANAADVTGNSDTNQIRRSLAMRS